MGNKLTHEEFCQRVRDIYGDKIEVVSQFDGTVKPVDIIYKCKHGEIKTTVNRAGGIIKPNVVKCYCKKCKYPLLEQIYVGAKFGDWEVIDDTIKNSRCLCRCKCGVEAMVTTHDLRTGGSKSCGCFKKDENYIKAFTDKMRENNKKYNRYEDKGDYVVMYTTKDEPFFVDKEDFDKVKNICWSKNNGGYLTGNAGNRKIVMLHRYIMDAPDDMLVDHVHGSETKHDNRRSNLRLATRAQNQMNVKLSVNNTSGCTGVYYKKDMNKWIAQIGIGRYEDTGKVRCKYLGAYENIEDAIKARKEAEEQYYGEFSRDNSRGIEKENEDGTR